MYLNQCACVYVNVISTSSCFMIYIVVDIKINDIYYKEQNNSEYINY